MASLSGVSIFHAMKSQFKMNVSLLDVRLNIIFHRLAKYNMNVDFRKSSPGLRDVFDLNDLDQRQQIQNIYFYLTNTSFKEIEKKLDIGKAIFLDKAV